MRTDRLIAVVRRSAQAIDPDAEIGAKGSAWRAFGGLAFWVLRLILDAPGTVAGFRRWVLAAAPVAPGIRAGRPADGDPLALAPGERDATTDERNDQEAERLPREVTAQNEPHTEAESSTSDAPSHDALIPGETKRQALIRLYEHCGELGDPRYGNRAKTAELAGEIAARIGLSRRHRAPRAREIPGVTQRSR